MSYTRKYFFVLCPLWTLVVAGLLWWNLTLEKTNISQIASFITSHKQIEKFNQSPVIVEFLAAVGEKHIRTLYLEHGFLWLLGLIFITWGWWQLEIRINVLQKSKDYIQTIIDNIGDPILVIDCQNYQIVLANKIVKEMAGGIDPAAKKLTCYQVSHHKDILCQEDGELCPLAEVMATKVPVKVTHIHLDAEDKHFTFSIVASPIFDENGNVIQIIESCRDISQELAKEAHVLQAQKMEAIGLLAAGIAHDFNNLLTSILGHTKLLKLDNQSESRVFQAAEVIEAAAERATKLTEQLLGFARSGKLQNIPVNIHTIIQEVVDFLNRTIHKNINIELQLTAKNPFIMGDPNQIGQVFLNLAVNSRDAMPAGGELIFSTAEKTFEAEYVKNHPGIVPGQYIIITVTDTGQGIPEEIISRIFEPFFTTKEAGKGSGMGLAMVYGIVKNHHGVIQVQSELGQGTSFQLYFPATTKRKRDTTITIASFEETSVTGGQEHILLVDDEEIIQKVTSEMLQRLGYKVTALSNGAEAVNYYQKHISEIDLVILDLSMPNMTGGECFHILKQINPHLKAIISTGYGMDEVLQELLNEGLKGVIQKPYRYHTLALKIREALDA